MAIAETSIVPTTSGSTPNLRLANSGVHSVPVRNSSTGTSCRNSNVSNASTPMMPAVVSTESRAHRNKTRSTIHSSVRVDMTAALTARVPC